MRELYDIAGISKQALWKYKQRRLHVGETTEHIVNIMTDLRVRHKRMGCRSMYYATTEEISVGRDNFEKIGFANGFKLKRKPNKQKTTWSQRVMIFPNLIEGKVLNGINQVSFFWIQFLLYYFCPLDFFIKMKLSAAEQRGIFCNYFLFAASGVKLTIKRLRD
jgi:hypothetical protein